MLWCWEHSYQDRPTFTQVKQELSIFQASRERSQICSNIEASNVASSNQIYLGKFQSDTSNADLKQSTQNKTQDFKTCKQQSQNETNVVFKGTNYIPNTFRRT